MKANANRQKGFNIIELMMVLAVVSILLSVGVPSFRGVVMDNRMSNQSNSFVTSINSARSYAVRYQRNATICATADYSAAVPTCDATTDWSNGWFIWVDKDRDLVTDANEVISVHEPLSDASTFSSTAASSFTYDARGFSVNGGDNLTLCDSRNAETGRQIRVNNVGRTSVVRQVCS